MLIQCPRCNSINIIQLYKNSNTAQFQCNLCGRFIGVELIVKELELITHETRPPIPESELSKESR